MVAVGIDLRTRSAVKTTMRAFSLPRYGSPDVLRLGDVAAPVLADDRVLVRVVAVSVNPVDWHTMRGQPFLVRLSDGLRRPKSSQLGADVAGVVEAVGSAVTSVRVGDQVFGMSFGTFAEYVAVSEAAVVPKPANLGFEEAAAVPVAAITALQGLRDRGRLRPGQRVLVNGASGGVGTFAVQLARVLGAASVTGVTSTGNIELVRSIGADAVVDYTRDDFTRSGDRYDVIFDGVGNRSLSDFRRVLAPGGTVVLCGAGSHRRMGPVLRFLEGVVRTRTSRQTFMPFLAHGDTDDLRYLAGLLEAGTIRPVIDRRYPFAELPEAIRYIEAGHARGKVVVSLPLGTA